MALGICTFCLSVLLALLPTGLQAQKESVELTYASSLAAEIVADLEAERNQQRLNPTGQSVSRFNFALPTGSTGSSMASGSNPDSTFFIAPNGEYQASLVTSPVLSASKYRVDVGFDLQAANNNSLNATAVRVVISWPAQAPGPAAGWPDTLDNSFELITYMDFSL